MVVERKENLWVVCFIGRYYIMMLHSHSLAFFVSSSSKGPETGLKWSRGLSSNMLSGQRVLTGLDQRIPPALGPAQLSGTIDVLRILNSSSVLTWEKIVNCSRHHGNRALSAFTVESVNWHESHYDYTIATLTLSISIWSRFRHCYTYTFQLLLKAPDDLTAARYRFIPPGTRR